MSEGPWMARSESNGRRPHSPALGPTGFGFYCNFTDPELRGKPPEKGNYKVMSVGKIRLAPDVMLEVSISADSFHSL